MPHSSESDSGAPEAISLKIAKKSSKAQDKLVQDRNTQVAKRAKDKNRARDARLKAAKEEATNNRSAESDPSLEKHGGGRKERSVRGRRPLPEAEEDGDDDEERVDVGPNEEEEEEEEEEDPTRKRIRARMEAAMHDAEEDGEGLSDEDGDDDDDDDAEALDGDFPLGEDASITDGDGELEGMSVDDEEMKDPEADDDDDEWAGLPGPRTSVVDPGYLPDEIFAQAAAAITAQQPRGGRAKAVERKKRNRKRVRAKDLVVGSRTVRVAKNLNPVVMAAYTVPSNPAQRFVRQHLKGGLATKGWERRPVNVGSLAVRGGPAKRFRRA